jgi:hypothetical protein
MNREKKNYHTKLSNEILFIPFYSNVIRYVYINYIEINDSMW